MTSLLGVPVSADRAKEVRWNRSSDRAAAQVDSVLSADGRRPARPTADYRHDTRSSINCRAEPARDQQPGGSTMCGTDHAHDHDHFGFLVDTPEVRALIDET